MFFFLLGNFHTSNQNLKKKKNERMIGHQKILSPKLVCYGFSGKSVSVYLELQFLFQQVDPGSSTMETVLAKRFGVCLSISSLQHCLPQMRSVKLTKKNYDLHPVVFTIKKMFIYPS